MGALLGSSIRRVGTGVGADVGLDGDDDGTGEGMLVGDREGEDMGFTAGLGNGNGTEKWKVMPLVEGSVVVARSAVRSAREWVRCSAHR